jgi:hypothetical protein
MRAPENIVAPHSHFGSLVVRAAVRVSEAERKAWNVLVKIVLPLINRGLLCNLFSVQSRRNYITIPPGVAGEMQITCAARADG